MKNLLWFVLLSFASSLSHAFCTYQRTDMDLISCEAVRDIPSLSADEHTAPAPLPGLEEPPPGPVAAIRCACQYILRGSNPLCDPERHEEFSSLLPEDPSAPLCRRRKSLCAAVCPKLVP